MLISTKTVAAVLASTIFLTACSSSSQITSFQTREVNYNDSSWCVPPRLKMVLNRVSRRFGEVTVTSTRRRWLENRRVGGARGSYHRRCQAVDFRVAGGSSAVLSYLRSQDAVGGYKLYSGGHFHIDNGPRRTW